MVRVKFVIIEKTNGDLTGYVTAPYCSVSKDKSKAKVFDEALDACLTAFALKKQNRREYLVVEAKVDK